MNFGAADCAAAKERVHTSQYDIIVKPDWHYRLTPCTAID
jgi:hypothetical protein